MKKDIFQFTTRFKPSEWDALLEDSFQSGRGTIFRRGIELVHDAQSQLSRPGQCWLDLGCGTGRLAQYLADGGSQVIGVDADRDMLRFARKKAKGRTPAGCVMFVGATTGNLPIAGDSVDGVVTTSLMGCLSTPRDSFLEIYRTLRTGGYAVVTFTNRHSILLRINDFLSKLFPLRKQNEKKIERFHLYSVKEARQLFKEAGLQVIKIRFYNFFIILHDRIFPRASNALNRERLRGKILPNLFARNFLFIAKKP